MTAREDNFDYDNLIKNESNRTVKGILLTKNEIRIVIKFFIKNFFSELAFIKRRS